MNKFGLIGSNVKYSYSKTIHENLYNIYNIKASYDLISVDYDELENCINKLRTNEYLGFNVTVPYKTEILKYVDEVSDSVLKLNSCNTLRIVNGKIYADNTDVYGFDMLLKYYNIKLKDTFILGSGGSSKSIQYVLNNLNVNYTIISRNSDFNYKFLENNFKNHDIINTTPIGMYPNIEESVLNFDIASKANKIIDLIYNPNITKLMSYNQKSYNGIVMLVYQGVKAFEIWNNIEVDKEIVKKIIKELEVK